MSNALCEEMILNIFSRVPTKSLLRFRSASKSLCARIGSHGFIRLHILRSPEKVMIIHQLLYERKRNFRNIFTLHSEGSLPYNPCVGIPIEFPLRSGSSNGILCIGENGNLHLWSSWGRGFYDRIYADGVFGFGFDPTINDYKILRMSKEGSFVYTMKTQTWRQIASRSTPFTFVKYYQCLFDGALYWTVTVTDVHGVFNSYIMKFDLSSEVFSIMELPEPDNKINQVTIIKGCLAVIYHGTRIWLWKKSKFVPVGNWFPEYKLGIDTMKHALRVLQITPNDELYIVYRTHVISYNLVTNFVRRLKDLRDYSTSIVGMDMCEESLGMLDMNTSSESFHVSFSKMSPF